MDNNVVALFPGGFKPPHGGHLAIANWLADKYSKVIVIIGKKSRDNISNIKSKHIWGMLPFKNNVEVIVSEDVIPLSCLSQCLKILMFSCGKMRADKPFVETSIKRF